MRTSTLFILASAAVAAAISAIEAVGNKLFDQDGKQFFIRGVAYQLKPDDPLLDTEQCQRDAALMKTLGANTIRVYHVDPDGDHTGCMTAFADVGIYLLVDLDTFSTYILGDDPTWSRDQYDAYARVMDAFSGFPNVLGFFVGNENIAQKSHSTAAPYIKAAARDMKTYRDAKGYRAIPVGYSAADIVELRPSLQDYLTCGGNASETIDFFSLNSYSWCDPSSYTGSDYAQLQEHAAAFPVPIFFSETGCIQPGPRLFDDQDAVFGPNMIHDWSGSIVYEWINEQNQYGLITYGPPSAGTDDPAVDLYDGFTRRGTPTPKQPDFDNLSRKWAAITPSGVARSEYDVAAVSTRPCPASTADGWWLVEGDVRLPVVGEQFTPGPSSPSSTPSESKSTITSTITNTDAGATTATPTPDPNGDDGNKQDDEGGEEEGSANADKHIAGMAAGLVLMMMVFTVWL